jgi:hypothetical protein
LDSYDSDFVAHCSAVMAYHTVLVSNILNYTFMLQVLEAIAPPYTPEFVQLFLPMVENEEITGTMRGDGENDLVSEFIGR